jgi:hypothetical protein
MKNLHKKYLRTIAKVSLLSLLLPVAAEAQTPDTLMAVYDKGSGLSRMSLHVNGSFLLGGNYDDGMYTYGGIPAEGAGTRFMWYPERASLRAGYVQGTQWDDANIGYHSLAIGFNSRASGDYGVALGNSCVAANVSSFAVGELNTASGAASVALGYHAHTNARQGSFVFADRSSVDEVRAGVNHSANWRVSGGFRIFTSSNLSTGVTLQSGASVSNWGQTNAVISTSTGAYLSTAGVWQSVSDVNRKHLFETVSGEDILSRLRNIEIKSWSYRTENDSVRHLGPTSQDFHAAFGLGSDERSIGTVDADGVALAGVQALDARSIKQAEEIEELKVQNKALNDRLDAMEKQRASGINMAGLSPYLIVLMGTACIAGLMIRRRSKS